MEQFVGLDVSVAETSICIVDQRGKVVRETRVASEPEPILTALTAPGIACRRIGLEAQLACSLAHRSSSVTNAHDLLKASGVALIIIKVRKELPMVVPVLLVRGGNFDNWRA